MDPQDAPDNPTPDDADDPAGDPPRTYTAQELSEMDAKDLSELVGGGRVQKVMAREKDGGRRSGERNVLDKLGFKDLDEAAAWTTQRRNDEASKLTEAERRQQEAERANSEAEATRRQAEADRQALRVERKLTRAKVNDTSMDDAIALIRLEPDADDDAIDAAIDALKTRQPAMFTSTNPAPPTPSGSPGGTPPRPQPSGDAYQRGVDRAKARQTAAAG